MQQLSGRLVVEGVSFPAGHGPLAPLGLELRGPVVVLYGRNGTGKTRVLDGLRDAAGDPSVPRGAASLHITFVGPDRDDMAPTFGTLLRDRVFDACRRHVEIVSELASFADPNDDDPVDANEDEAAAAVILKLAGVPPALAVAIAAQKAWILDRADDGYYLSVAARIEGDVARMLPGVVAEVPYDATDGPFHQAMTRLRTAQNAAAGGSYRPSWPILDVIIDPGAVQPPIWTEVVPAAVGLVTEGALAAALGTLAREVSELLKDSPVLILGAAVEPEQAVADLLQDISDRATDILRLLLLDAPALSVELSPPWGGDSMLRVQGVDGPSGEVVPIADLSSAEGRWAALAVQLAVRIRQLPGGNLLLVLDEPDAGLHPRALAQAAAGMTELSVRYGCVAVVATHSPVLLGMPQARPVHVTRPASGTRLRPLAVEEIAALDGAAAGTLNLTRGEVLLLARIHVVVEGEHDEALIRTWLADELAAARARIFPLRGTHNLSSILDSHVLLPATDGRLLVVVDATRARLAAAWEEVLAAPEPKRGSRLHKARTRLEKERPLSDEERRVWQMLESAVQGDEAERLYIHGFASDDIIEYLPAPVLTGKAGADWSQLKREWRRTRNHAQPFKPWLNAQGVRTDPGALVAAAADVPPPDEFVALGRRLLEIASQPR